MLTARTNAVALGAVLTATAWLSGADPLDPTLPQRAVVGTPAGPTCLAELDSRRSGRTTAPLPKHPRVLWRLRVPGSLQHSLAANAQGTVVAASTSHLIGISSRGKVVWTARLGTSGAATGPIVTSAGSLLVVTADGEVHCVDAAGHPEWQRSLSVPATSAAAPPLPTRDGGAVVSMGSGVWQLESDGTIRAQTTAADNVISILEGADGLLLVTGSGSVIEWKAPAPPRDVGDFGGRPTRGVTLIGSQSLVAVVDDQRLVELTVKTGSRRVRVPEGPAPFWGPPAVTAHDETRILDLDGFLLGHDAKGRETTRLPLDLGATPGAPTTQDFAQGIPPLVIDPADRVAIARPGLDVAVIGRTARRWRRRVPPARIRSVWCRPERAAWRLGAGPAWSGWWETSNLTLATRPPSPYALCALAAGPGGHLRMITLTPLAAEKVREIAEAEGLAQQGLRLRVLGGGCAGFQYDLFFEESPTAMDETFESEGIKLYVDPLSFQYLDGTEIDFVETVLGSGFKFKNPNVSGTCGCGSSFQI
jgi:iron-sulfur cluster insertion protein